MSGSTSYQVSARINITGNYAQVMRQLGSSLAGLDRQILHTEQQLLRLAGLFPMLGRVIQHVSTASVIHMSQMRGAVAGMSAAMQGANRATSAQASAMARNTQNAIRATQAANALAHSMRQLSQIPAPHRIPPPGRGGGGGGGRRAREDDRPGAFGRGLAGAPSAAYSAGYAAQRGIGAIFSQGGEAQTLETLMRVQQVPQAQIDAVRAAMPAWLEQAPGATSVDALQAFNEARAVIGDEGGTNFAPIMQMVPDLLKAARLSAVLRGTDTQEGLRPFARFLANRGSFTGQNGQLDMATGQSELMSLMSAAMAYTTRQGGEGVDPKELENLGKRMGIAGRRMSIEGIAGALFSVMQENGRGDLTATMLNAFADNIVTGTRSKETTGRMSELNLLRRNVRGGPRAALGQEIALINQLEGRGEITAQEAQTARTRSAQPPPPGTDPVLHRGLASVRPDKYMQHGFTPIVANRPGVRNADGSVNEDAVIDIADSLKMRQTTRRFLMTLLQFREVANDISNWQRIEEARRAGADPAGDFIRNSFAGASGNVVGSFVSLLQELGRSQSVIGFLNQMAANLRELTAWVRANPGFMDRVVAELSRFLGEARTFAVNLADVVNRIATVVRDLGIGGPATNPDGSTPPPLGQVPLLRRGLEGLGWRFRDQPAPDGAAPRPGAGLLPGLGMPATPASFSPIPPGGGDVILRTVINMDGREVAEVVSRHQGRSANAPPAGARVYDYRRGGYGPEPRTRSL